MLRLFLFLGITALLSAAGVWLADHPGNATLVWQNYQIETSVAFLALLAILLGLFMYAVFTLMGYMLRLPTRWRRHARYKRQQQGLDALTHAFIALTASDTTTAKRMLAKADTLIERPTLTHLLSSQLARLEGDETGAVKHLEAMLEHKDSTWIALQGLTDTAIKRGDWNQALAHAERAYALKPRDEWLNNTLISLYCRLERWDDAAFAVRKSRKSAAEKKHLNAVIDTLQAQQLMRLQENDRALRFAHKAFKLQPGFVPAVALFAELTEQAGKRDKALTILAEGWKHHPHPLLWERFSHYSAGETSEALMKRAGKLYARQPEHVESQLALAQAALKNGDWQIAREQLEKARESQDMHRIYPMLAALEQQSMQDTVAAKEWQTKGEHAPADPTWTCRSCQSVSESWTAHCRQCGGFDTLEWKQNKPVYVALN